jgi:outer membrane lipopolysaccharide assembly protein LptE/RlpB
LAAIDSRPMLYALCTMPFNPRFNEMTLLKTLLVLICVATLSGCGYQLAGKDTHLPPGVTSVAIPTLVNKTLEPGVEIVFTQAFLREFIKDRRVKVVDRREADSVVEGIIKSFYIFSASYDKSGYALEYQTVVTMDIALKKRNGEIIWAEKDLIEMQWYRTNPSVIATEDNRVSAIQQVAKSVAERILNRFYYNF